MAVATAMVSNAMATTLMQIPMVSRRCDTVRGLRACGSTVSETVTPDQSITSAGLEVKPLSRERTGATAVCLD